MRNCFGPLKLKVNGKDIEFFVYLKLNTKERKFDIISIEDEHEQTIYTVSINLMTQVKTGFDRICECECIKIRCFRKILFLKLYPISNTDIAWFPEVIEALLTLKKGSEREGVDAEDFRQEIFYKESELYFHEYLNRLITEYERILSKSSQTVSSKWRFSSLNRDYALCSTYSQILAVPEKISDTVLLHAAKFRVKNRFPLLSYLFEGRALMRSGQPLVGLTQRRSVQDEKLIEAMKACSTDAVGVNEAILIVDARPSKSVMANTVIGAGIERLDCYSGSERIFLNIENIHTIRESHDRLSYQIKSISRSIQSNNHALWIEVEERCDWLDFIRIILEGVKRIVEAITVDKKHILIHCSDGWDRTAQLISLSQLCLDPYYRTKEGFKVLIEKDWLSAGHRFADRVNASITKSKKSISNTSTATPTPWDTFKNNFYPSNNSNGSMDEEECPIFLQFIEVVVQLCRQYPLHFPELSDKFLLQIVDEVMSGGSDFFYGNCEKDRQHKMTKLEVSDTNETMPCDNYDINVDVDTQIFSDDGVIVPKVERSKMILWPAYYKRYF